MIRYDRLWKTMEEKELTQYRLIKQHGFSAGQIGRLKKNMHVSTHTIETLCGILQCGVGDIIEFWPDDMPWPSEETVESPAEAVPQKEEKPKAKKSSAKPSKASVENAEKENEVKTVKKALKKAEKDTPAPDKEAVKKPGKAKPEKPGKEKQPKPEKEKKTGKIKKDKTEKKNKDKKKK